MSIKAADILGVQIHLHYTWFIIFTLFTWSLAVGYLPDQYPTQTTAFYWAVGAASAASLFLSVTIHEISHSIMAKRNGIKVRRITLHFFGGVAEMEEEAKTPNVEFKVAAVGPFTSLALAALFASLWRLASAGGLPLGVTATLRYASYINLVLALFNLAPAFPMDGGRILRSILWKRSGDLLASTRRATRVSQAFSYLLVALGLMDLMAFSVFSGVWFIVVGFIILRGAEASLDSTRISEALGGVTVGEIMTTDVHTVEPGVTLSDLVDDFFMMYKHGGFPVVSGGRLVGMVTDHDVRQVPRERWPEVKVRDVMKPAEGLITVTAGNLVSDAFIRMSQGEVGRLPVVDGGRIVGIVTRSDINRAVKMRLQFKL